jgi:hypothetical protein
MERIAFKTTSFTEAEQWDRAQSWAMSPEERLRILRMLQEKVYGKNAPDIRESGRIVSSVSRLR